MVGDQDGEDQSCVIQLGNSELGDTWGQSVVVVIPDVDESRCCWKSGMQPCLSAALAVLLWKMEAVLLR
ncbi:hypothetical protein P7K49_027442 [Saguinus oedipus]|uniref:Uncharacterized protein n=1 Tax=Saguinus oedipus TaxID=9490 RepID=A0ABQ9U9G9_SAGOE|nr:hypothetical protein P7K49_027442 [Saguinus oedipus]